MAIKLSKEIPKLIDTLKERQLLITDDKLASDCLKKTNYFQMINGFENILLPTALHPKQFNGKEAFEDFEYLYQFDRDLSSTISGCIYNVEESLKTSVAYHFANFYCSGLNDTMQYTNKNNYRNPRWIPDYPFACDNYRFVISDFDEFIFFKQNYLKKLISQNDFIQPEFYKDDNYEPPVNVCTYRYDSHVAVPLWVAIQTVDFGTLIRMCHYLDTELINSVLADFGFSPSNKFEFLNSLDLMRDLRNKCAHSSLITRYKTPKKLKINNKIITTFDLRPRITTPDNHRLKSVISLFDSLKVLSYFTNLSSIYKLLIKQRYTFVCRSASIEIDADKRILHRMGNDQFNKWINLTKQSPYYQADLFV
ncbi:Abi family protein [Oenococcus oeni]|uniref:Abi family protein n=1 Tax=Oenococcus oeni TaxID=1247 RepID=UPI0010B1DF21|nr:Abi family protein [Oenococcus oeni]SYW14879.1 Abi family protein [Oenococcus oeni]